MNETGTDELNYRLGLWQKLIDAGGPIQVAPSLLRQLRIYGGAQGVWVDKERTHKVTNDGAGITVGLLHTGSSYKDDLTDEGVLYHYPNTKRKGHDLAEINATKRAAQLKLPVFVITYPTTNSIHRTVHLGWIEGWDDEAKIFLIFFGNEQPVLLNTNKIDEKPFNLSEKATKKKSEINRREGQQRFKFQVLQRYGMQCAVCDVKIAELLDAAHIRPKSKNGSDDPRNGFILCATHHRAFDAGFFAIEPSTLNIIYKSNIQDKLNITYKNLEHLNNQPHIEALNWHWKYWKKRYI